MSEHEHEGPSCRELLRSLSEYIDGELDESLCEIIENHMSGCERCEVVVDTLRKTIELYQHVGAAPPVPDDVRARLFMRLNLDDFLVKSGSPQAGDAHTSPDDSA